MEQLIIRLDDACEKRNINNWDRMENLLDDYGIHPLVGVIPNCEDQKMDGYQIDPDFWKRVNRWKEKGWEIALHGYNHVYLTNEKGINPVNGRSEFAGVSLEIQMEKIEKGIQIFKQHGITPSVFYAPAHTFDYNTIKALKLKSTISIISDTIASQAFFDQGMTFVPQQMGRVRRPPLPMKMVTYCYHPNSMTENDFKNLAIFLQKYSRRFVPFPTEITHRKKTAYDKFLSKLYFARRVL